MHPIRKPIDLIAMFNRNRHRLSWGITALVLLCSNLIVDKQPRLQLEIWQNGKRLPVQGDSVVLGKQPFEIRIWLTEKQDLALHGAITPFLYDAPMDSLHVLSNYFPLNVIVNHDDPTIHIASNTNTVSMIAQSDDYRRSPSRSTRILSKKDGIAYVAKRINGTSYQDSDEKFSESLPSEMLRPIYLSFASVDQSPNKNHKYGKLKLTWRGAGH
jgi:hypothetical protein